MESFNKDDIQMFHGDGEHMLREIVPHKSADIIVVDNPFRLSATKKLWMYSAVGASLKDDGVVVVFDDERGWEETLIGVKDYYQVLKDFYLIKNRTMRKPNGQRTNTNIMKWMTPSIFNHTGFKSEYQIGYVQGEPISKKSKIGEQWLYNSSDKLGLAAGCKRPHSGSKGIGMAGFILTHLAACLDRSDIVVADPYGGSGTFAIASQLLGFKCYSSEIEEKVYMDAKTKFSYAMKKAQTDKYWFREAIKQFRDRIVG